MNSERKEKPFLEGYRAGYLDGIAAGQAGVAETQMELTALPLEALGLSVRSVNCLRAWGCDRISDVVAMSTEMIYSVPHFGKVCADEVARSLFRHQIFLTAWDSFLLK